MAKRWEAVVLAVSGFMCATSASASLSANDASNTLSRNNIVADSFSLPVTGIDYNNFGFEYGQLWDAATTNTLHTGVDLNTSNDCGRQVTAIGNGVVRFKGSGGGTWGGIVLIQHRYWDTASNGYREITSQYAHIAPLDSLSEGQTVSRGEQIGYIADRNTGSCAAFAGVANYGQWDVTWNPHLHFEIRTDINLSATNWPSRTSFQNLINTVDAAGCANILSASGQCRQRAVDLAGYTDPLDFIGSHSQPTAQPVVLDGAGSLIDPRGTCSGCNADYVLLHPHQDKLSAGVFQVWPGDAAAGTPMCAAVRLEGLLKAKVEIRNWQGRGLGSVYYDLAQLPATINLPDTDNWYLVAVKTVAPIPAGETRLLKASCVAPTAWEPNATRLAGGTPMALDGGYGWGGNGSLITMSGSYKTVGREEDLIATLGGTNTQGIFQVYSGSTCKRPRLYTDFITVKVATKAWSSAAWSAETPVANGGAIPLPAAADWYLLRFATYSPSYGTVHLICDD